jgi:hypothetical protein
MAIDDFIKKPKEQKELDIFQQEIALFKLLIRENKGPFDLIRELISNSASKEVGSTQIDISYSMGKEGHIFEVTDNGCGMDYLGNVQIPGRLDRFLGLGFSAIIGLKSDEFSFKGLGSKLAYQSNRIEIETRYKNHNIFSRVFINDPWGSLERKTKPNPQYTSFEDNEFLGTKIKVMGHPIGAEKEPFERDDMKDFIFHRTFIGFTSKRDNAPEITFSYLGKDEDLKFGFPEFRKIPWADKQLNDKGLLLDKAKQTLFIRLMPKSPKKMRVILKGFLTWNPEDFNLYDYNLNRGLILSTKGIPYFELDLEEYGATNIRIGRPGWDRTCLVVECDDMHSEMNISRSDLTNSPKVTEFRKILRELLNDLELSKDYLEFRQMPESEKKKASANHILEQKRTIESDDQNWVILEKETKKILLLREPENENEVNALIWKMEALDALPFRKFQTLSYIGAKKGPDLLVSFQEDDTSEFHRGIVFEIERNFYSYKGHGHSPSQYPKVICWNIPQSGKKVRVNPTSQKHKFTIEMDDYQVHIYVLKLMDGIRVVRKRELQRIDLDL